MCTPVSTPNPDFCIALSTFPDSASAHRVAQTLVQAKLAACAQVSAPITSFYTWQGQLQQDGEVQLILKTRSDLLPKLEQQLRNLHPYTLPQLVWFDAKASHDYQNWLIENLQPLSVSM